MYIERAISNKKEKYRHVVRDCLSILLVVTEAFLFFYVWTKFMNPNIRVPYRFKGNYFLVAVYTVLNLVFSKIYGGMKIGYYRVFDLILSQSICAVITNLVGYFVIVIPVATWFLSPVPMIWLTAADIVVVIIWCMAGNRIFVKIFPPQKLIVLYGDEAELLAAKFANRPDRYKIEKKIHLDIDTVSRDPGGFLDTVIEECRSYDGVIIGDISSELRNDVLKKLYSIGIRTYTLPKVSDVILKSSEILHIFDSPVMLNRNYGLTMEQEIAKRVFDIICSGIGIILASPFLIITALAIRLDDGGPVFFKQKRCTKDGKIFEIIKFRSMIVDAEKDGISNPATDHDPRITKVGAFIRMTRIDELPQLFNIFKGDMSIVGPRPERVEHVEKYTAEIPEFQYRLMVKGGLTGYAQIYGKYNTTAYDKLKLDLMYIQNYSLLLDISLILKTIKIVLMKESTEGFKDDTESK